VEGKKLTAAYGLSRRPYDEPTNLEEDEELQEDSFITAIDPDIFDFGINSGFNVKERDRQWHILNLSTEEDMNEGQSSQNDDLHAHSQRNGPIPMQSVDIFELSSSQGRDIQTLQHESKDLQPILNWLEKGVLSDSDKEARQVILQAEHFLIVDGLLHHLHYPRTKRLNEITPVIQHLCVPTVLREDLLIAYHDNNAHVGRERLYDTLKQKYYFPQMYTSVIEYVSSYDICQKKKTSPHTHKAPLAPLPIVEPFGRVHIDHVGPLPVTAEGYRHHTLAR